MGVSSEIGALDETKTTATFERLSNKLTGCLTKGTERIPYLSGDVRFVVRISETGAAKWAFVKDSTIGDRKTEDCMLSALTNANWPKPVGGEGIAEKDFSWPAQERPPVEWSPAQLGKALQQAKPALSSCRASSGARALKVTLYVDVHGKPAGIGVSSSDEKGEKAAACVVSALERLTFPKPGSYAAKATISIE
jgi:hypothetical protein